MEKKVNICLAKNLHISKVLDDKMSPFFQVLDDITESIFMSSEACPRTLRYICACLQRDVQNRCGNVKKTLALVFMLVGGLKRGLSKLE